ncbi:MAG: endonuclease/exonuclease/phosphatase family protein [Saprospiraceae bacterium]
MIKIISWNIRQGGGSRILKIIRAIQNAKPHIITLNEYHNNKSGIRLRNELLHLGYRYQFVTNSPNSVNSVIIASKIPCESRIFPESDRRYANNIICASFVAFDLYGVYFPHKKKHRLFNFFLDHLPLQKPSIITGDFNSGINGVDQKGNSFWYENELMALDKIQYIDAFRFKNGGIKEYSWYSYQGNGYRYDHTYIHDDLSPITTACYYNHQIRLDGISDHSMMVLELG